MRNWYSMASVACLIASVVFVLVGPPLPKPGNLLFWLLLLIQAAAILLGICGLRLSLAHGVSGRYFACSLIGIIGGAAIAILALLAFLSLDLHPAM